MSLIHEALKKAQQEGQSGLQKEMPRSRPILPGKKIPPRTVLLVVILVLSLGFLLFTRYFWPAPNVPAPSPLPPTGLLKMDQSPEVLKQTALRLFNEKKYEAALAAWEKLTLSLPTDAEIYNNMGLVLKKLGRREEAYQAYTKALALQADYPEALNNLGALFLAEGQRAEAKKNFERALEFSPNYADPHFHLAILAEQEGNNTAALQHYETFLKQSPPVSETLKGRLEKKMELLSR